jgi:hypothetical protein
MPSLSRGARIERGRAAVQARARNRALDLAPIIQELQAAGCESLRAIAAGLEERGIPTPRGGSWSAVQVAHCWRRLPSLSTQAPGSPKKRQTRYESYTHCQIKVRSSS